jgi:hypothetical protein
MNRTEWALVVVGQAGFFLVGLGHIALGWRGLTYAGVLVAGVATVWLAVIVQRRPRQ